MNKVLCLTVLDHEHEYNVDASGLKGKDLSVKVYGELVYEDKDLIVLSNWIGDNNQDVYRILKKCVIKRRVLK